MCICVFKWYGGHLDLNSFPTRRSSDLRAAFDFRVASFLMHGGEKLIFVDAGCKDVRVAAAVDDVDVAVALVCAAGEDEDRKSTRLNSSHANISYAVFCLIKKTLDLLIG